MYTIMLVYLHPLPHTSPGFQPFFLLRSPVRTNQAVQSVRAVTGLRRVTVVEKQMILPLNAHSPPRPGHPGTCSCRT